MLAIVLLVTGVTFATAQKKESTKLQKAQKTEAAKTAEVATEVQSNEMVKPEASEAKIQEEEQAKAAEMNAKEAAKPTDDSLSVQIARKESVE